MINRYFGVPGCGKTTHLASVAIKENERIKKGVSHYERVLTNVPLTGLGDDSNVYLFSPTDFGRYDMSNALILYDEAEVDFNNRDYKNLDEARTRFLMYHRHYRSNIYFYSQTYDGVDKKIRFITNNVYYLKRNIITGKTTPHRIKYLMYIPKKPKRDEIVNDNNGEITMRYYQSGFFEHLFSMLLLEPPIKLARYWSYFDSYDAPELPIKDFEVLT